MLRSTAFYHEQHAFYWWHGVGGEEPDPKLLRCCDSIIQKRMAVEIGTMRCPKVLPSTWQTGANHKNAGSTGHAGCALTRTHSLVEKTINQRRQQFKALDRPFWAFFEQHAVVNRIMLLLRKRVLQEGIWNRCRGAHLDMSLKMALSDVNVQVFKDTSMQKQIKNKIRIRWAALMILRVVYQCILVWACCCWFLPKPNLRRHTARTWRHSLMCSRMLPHHHQPQTKNTVKFKRNKQNRTA